MNNLTCYTTDHGKDSELAVESVFPKKSYFNHAREGGTIINLTSHDPLSNHIAMSNSTLLREVPNNKQTMSSL